MHEKTHRVVRLGYIFIYIYISCSIVNFRKRLLMVSLILLYSSTDNLMIIKGNNRHALVPRTRSVNMKSFPFCYFCM